ncbi:MAG: hypothetical protein KDD33_01325 [Bdellovibrionales bacterium]|nr:hypothetical protein [Bdellovibrionales bacterium]
MLLLKPARNMRLAVIASLLFSPTVYAENGARLRDLRSGALLALGVNLTDFAWRCPQIINCGHGVRDTAGCATQVQSFANAFQAGGSGNYLEDEMKKLANDRSAHRLLRNILRLTKQDKEFNLWNIAYQGFGRDKEKAMRFLATYFMQENSDSPHLSKEMNALKSEAFSLLVPKIREGKIQAYPPGVESKDATFYHFYIPAVMASNMRKQGIHDRYASAIPIAFNEAYEYVFFQGRSLFRKMKGKPSMGEMSYSDIYSGYAGVQFALSKDTESFSGPSSSKWLPDYRKRGAAAISDYLKKGLGGEQAFCNDEVPYERPAGVDIKREDVLRVYPEPVGTSN